jgi:sphinganine-1-phosphate aldolase
MSKYIVTNALHVDEFKSVSQMEVEIIRMIANMYHGDDKSCGMMTSGGTESILLACLAYREQAKERGVKYPNMVMNNTAHAAFDKAAFYFQIELRKVQLTKDLKTDMRAWKK